MKTAEEWAETFWIQAPRRNQEEEKGVGEILMNQISADTFRQIQRDAIQHALSISNKWDEVWRIEVELEKLLEELK